MYCGACRIVYMYVVGVTCMTYRNSSRYWYGNGCMYPDMATVFIAVDESTKENGRLEVNGCLVCAKLMEQEHALIVHTRACM